MNLNERVQQLMALHPTIIMIDRSDPRLRSAHDRYDIPVRMCSHR